MNRFINNILNPEETQRISQNLAIAKFIDGATTAEEDAKVVKHNQQMMPSSEYEVITKLVMAALYKNKEFQQYAIPSKLGDPLINKYSAGMSYGVHTDNPIMRCKRGHFRTDLTATVFLNDSTQYDGGELVIENGPGIKLSTGDVILYPADTLHQVLPVISGIRYAMVVWIESFIKDSENRQILGYVMNAKRSASDNNKANMDQVYGKLFRRWS